MSKFCTQCNEDRPNVANYCMICGYSFSGEKNPEIEKLEKKLADLESQISKLQQVNQDLETNKKVLERQIEVLKPQSVITNDEPLPKETKEKKPKKPKNERKPLSPLAKKRLLISLASVPAIAAIVLMCLPCQPSNVEIQYTNGIYKGEVKIENNDTIRHGKGIFIFNENSSLGKGTVIKGIWENNTRQGEFTAEKNGKTYAGTLKDGAGELTSDDGKTFNISQYD